MAGDLQAELGCTVQRMGKRCEDLVLDLVDAATRTQQMLLSAESLQNISGELMGMTSDLSLLPGDAVEARPVEASAAILVRSQWGFVYDIAPSNACNHLVCFRTLGGQLLTLGS